MTSEALSSAAAEGAGIVGTSGVDLAEIPTLGKDSTEPSSIVGSGTVADQAATSVALFSSLSKPVSDRSAIRTAARHTAADTEKSGEARAWTGPRDGDIRTLAIVSDQMEEGLAEAATRANLLDGEGPVDWEAIDRDLRQILDGLGLPGVREASRAGLAWVPWVGVVAGAYLSHRAAAGRRRLFRRDRSPRLSPDPLPVGPWPLSSP